MYFTKRNNSVILFRYKYLLLGIIVFRYHFNLIYHWIREKNPIFAPEMKKRLIRIFKIILPALFIAYLASTSFFYHTHIVNGVTIIHSHPFDKKEHTHTQEGYLIINLIAHFISDGVIVPHFSFTPQYTFTHYIIQPVINATAQGIIIPTSSRGPPYKA